MKKKSDRTFVKAFAQLEEISKWFESDDMDVEEGLQKFEQGLELASWCRRKLEEVENKVTKLKKS